MTSGVRAAYGAILGRPGASRLVLSSLLGRLGTGMVDLPMLLLAERASGSYAVAGGTVAAYSLAIAATAPARGRRVDALGSRRAVPPMAIVNAGALLALLLAARVEVVPLVVVAAAVAGAFEPPRVAAMRIEWQRILPGNRPLLERAYAFESSAQVAMFVVGPALAGALVAISGPSAALGTGALLGLSGGVAFGLRAGVAGGTRAPQSLRTSLRDRPLQTLVAVTILSDLALGVIDVTVVAFAERRGAEGAAGLLLALFALSSVAGGALYGARAWSAPVGVRLIALLLFASVAAIPLALADSIGFLAAALVLAGAPAAAWWATTSSALDTGKPDGAGAQTYSWFSMANAVGIGAGGALAGILIDLSGTSLAFWVGAGSLAAASAVAVARRGTLQPSI